jgi:hypothetical protein
MLITIQTSSRECIRPIRSTRNLHQITVILLRSRRHRMPTSLLLGNTPPPLINMLVFRPALQISVLQEASCRSRLCHKDNFTSRTCLGYSDYGGVDIGGAESTFVRAAPVNPTSLTIPCTAILLAAMCIMWRT